MTEVTDAPTRDWADELAYDILGWTSMHLSSPPELVQRYLAAELRMVRARGVCEGIDLLGAQLMKGMGT